MTTQTDEERIRQRAHEIFTQRGGGTGSDLDDWLQAEQEIQAASEQGRARRGRTPASHQTPARRRTGAAKTATARG